MLCKFKFYFPFVVRFEKPQKQPLRLKSEKVHEIMFINREQQKAVKERRKTNQRSNYRATFLALFSDFYGCTGGYT